MEGGQWGGYVRQARPADKLAWLLHEWSHAQVLQAQLWGGCQQMTHKLKERNVLRALPQIGPARVSITCPLSNLQASCSISKY